MDPDWRQRQVGYSEDAREKLAGIAGDEFVGWQTIVMFYKVVTIVDGCAEAAGRPAPTSHAARLRFVRRNFPHLAKPYEHLYNESVSVRYYDGYAMTSQRWCAVLRNYEIIMANISLP